jgi:hypothetical protein
MEYFLDAQKAVLLEYGLLWFNLCGTFESEVPGSIYASVGIGTKTRFASS